MLLRLGDLSFATPAVMGVLNVTPDSFSDGGRFADRDAAVRHAEAMANAGAALIDIGGESTRPGADAVTEQQELDRVIPVVEAIRSRIDLPISIDTSKPGVMRAAAAAGAALINDVRALREPSALEAAAATGVPVCLMHMQGQPRTMQVNPHYEDVTVEVASFLQERLAACADAGIGRERLLLDPGFGFGKTLRHNVELLANLRQLAAIGPPLLVGLSRKSSLGALTGRELDERLPASLAAAVVAVMHGASIVRAHDVAETVDAIKTAAAVLEIQNNE